MNYGPSRILTCPYCGKEKEVMSLLSGNTSGGVVWSDQYVEYPFYKVASDIQKCPHCMKYYIIDKEIEFPLSPKQVKFLMGEVQNSSLEYFFILNTKEYNWGRCAINTGELDYADMHRALLQLRNEITDKEQKRTLYLNYIQCYNTHFFRNNDGRRKPMPISWYWFVSCAINFLQLAVDSDVIFTAELQRELGLFDTCLKTLKDNEEELQDQHLDFREMIAEKASSKDNSPFIWKTIHKSESSIYIREQPNGLPLPDFPY